MYVLPHAQVYRGYTKPNFELILERGDGATNYKNPTTQRRRYLRFIAGNMPITSIRWPSLWGLDCWHSNTGKVTKVTKVTKGTMVFKVIKAALSITNWNWLDSRAPVA